MKYNGRVIDIHSHVMHPESISLRAEVAKFEPDFKILYEDPSSRLASTEDVLSHMDECDIDASVLLGFPWRSERLLKEHNNMILAASQKEQDILFALPCIYPFSDNAKDEAARCLDSGASGLGEVGLYERDLDSEYIDAMSPVMKICLERSKPLMLHVNEPVGHDYSGKAPISIKGIYDFIKAYPENKIILAHWGGGLLFFDLLKKEAKNLLKNVWYDSAASPYLYDKRIWNTAVSIVGADKILFGTDFPLLKAKKYISEIEESGLSTSEMELILYKNAESLLQLQTEF
ncbi:MAG: amidohydrolase family protein [Spirochaetales bacterium]|nr:amidohydrolase family protein [Spirochaetales bacterium]